MAFYIGEIKRLRKEFLDAYRDGEYQKAILLGREILQLYEENEDIACMEYAVDMSNLGMVYDQMRLYERAEDYYRRAAELKKTYSGESLSYADTLNNLAIVRNHQGQQEDALRLHGRVLEIRDRKLGREHIDYIHSLYHMGNTYELLGDMEHAIECHAKALQRARQCKEFPISDLGDLHGAIARAYEGKGNFKKAIYYYEVCLDLIEKARGCENLYYMIHVLLLAAVCEKAGWLELAVEYCEKAVALRREMMSSEHLDFINSLNSLAAICCKNKQFEKAISLHREVLEMVERLLGKEHIFYADALNNLSVDYAGMQAFTEALALNQEALHRKIVLLGEADPQVAVCLMSMGTLHENMGEPKRAMEYYERALAIRRTIEEGKNTACADTLTAMGKLCEKQGLLSAAEDRVREALEVRRSCGTQTGGMYVWNLQLLAELRRKQGDFDGAIALCREAAEIMEGRFGREHPRYAAALEKVGLAYEGADRLAEAEAILRQTADIRKEMLDEDNPLYLQTLEALARVLAKQKKYEEAIEQYREKNDVNFEETPQEQLAAATTLLAIANCYRLAGNPGKAEAYFAEAEAKQKRSGLPPEEAYTRRRSFYLRQKMREVLQTPPEETEDSPEAVQQALEYYSALALSVRRKEGESPRFAELLLKTAALHAKLGQRKDVETLLDRVLTIGAKEGVFTPSFGKLCDRVGQVYGAAGSREKAEATLRQAYQICTVQGERMTEEGHSLLLGLLQEKGDEKAYFIVKNGEKLE